MSTLAAATTAPGLSLALFFACLALILGMLLWCTVTERDRWPFSHYPMFGVATKANSVRFFILRGYFEDGSAAELRGAADALTDPFHRDFERMWTAGPLRPEITDELVVRYWREACRLDARLTPARRLEVVMRIGRLIGAQNVVVGEKAVHAVVTARGATGG